jgi:uncharacterized protein
LLSNHFFGSVSDGMPHGVGGAHHGPTEMVTRVRGRIATIYDIQPARSTWPSTRAAWWSSVAIGVLPGTIARRSTPHSRMS